MQYIVRHGDTLRQIALRYNIPITAILAINPLISNPDHLFVGQVLDIPNASDVPHDVLYKMPIGADNLVLRARSVVASPILYKLGSGGRFPSDALPSRDQYCDCSGFICWVLGLCRESDIPFYRRFGGWIYTDSMVSDIESTAGIFQRVSKPEPGCIVVYSAGSAIGHVGMVTDVKAGVMIKVVHCSSGNAKKFGAAIQETTPGVFNRADTVWGRFSG